MEWIARIKYSFYNWLLRMKYSSRFCQVFLRTFRDILSPLGKIYPALQTLFQFFNSSLPLFLQQGEYGLDEHKLHVYLSALQSLIPSLFAVLLQNAPFTSRAKLQGDVPPIEGEGRPTSTHARTRTCFSLTFSVKPRLAMQTWRLTQCNCRVPAMLRLLSGFGLTIKVLFHLRTAAVSDDLRSYAFLVYSWF